LTGKWTGVPSGGMDYGVDVLDSSVPSFRIDIDINIKLM